MKKKRLSRIGGIGKGIGVGNGKVTFEQNLKVVRELGRQKSGGRVFQVKPMGRFWNKDLPGVEKQQGNQYVLKLCEGMGKQ